MLSERKRGRRIQQSLKRETWKIRIKDIGKQDQNNRIRAICVAEGERAGEGVYPEGKGNECMAKEREESDTIKTMVEGIKDEDDRTLPILWDKREYANNEAVL